VKTAVVGIDCQNALRASAGILKPILSFGLSGGADVSAIDLQNNEGKYGFTVTVNRERIGRIQLKVAGKHNVENALAATASALAAGISPHYALSALSDFSGVGRRGELRGEKDGVLYYDDYAHHPTEIRATLSSLRGDGRLFCIFQPHTFSRTKSLADEFVAVLEGLEHLVLFKTYPAREEAILGGSAYDLYTQLDPKKAMYLENVDSLLSVIDREEKVFDCVLVLGAGDLAEKLKKVYKNRQLNNDGKIINYC
jgi:UDP-N-acetylmuramate--alanine ligase